jgi:hypothetical protein
MGTTSPELGRQEQEAHNRGSLEDNYISNLVNKASRDRVRVKYNDN